MFTLIEDDFDVDEDFLKNAFECETSANKPPVNVKEVQGRGTVKNHFNPPINTSNESINLEINNRVHFPERSNSNKDDAFFSWDKEIPSSSKNGPDNTRAVSPLGVRSRSFTRSSKTNTNVRQRKFPGPAGLLPERTSNTSFIAAEEYISNIEKKEAVYSEYEDEAVLSQDTNRYFEEPGSAWQTMVNDLGSSGGRLMAAINLSTIRIKQAKFGFKVPFLAVSVQNIDCSLPDPSLILKDKMDEMHGTLHRDVWEEWKSEIVVGSVLVLQNTGVISTGISSRRYFLNITANNIVTIYTPLSDNGINTLQIQPNNGFNTENVLQEWEKVMSQTRQAPFAIDTPEGKALYSTFSSPSVSRDRMSSPTAAGLSRPWTPPVRPAFRSRGPHSSPASFRLQTPSPGPSCVFSPGITSATSSPRRPLGSTVTNVRPPLTNKNPPLPVNFNPLQQSSPFTLKSPKFNSPSTNNTSLLGDITSNNFRLNTNSNCVPLKKPKLVDESENQQVRAASVFSIVPDPDKSIVESEFDGIDADLLFDDF